jgi:hypothetical protein
LRAAAGGGEHARRTIDLPVLPDEGLQLRNFRGKLKLTPICGNRFIIDAEDLGEQAVGLPGIPAKLGGDHVTSLLPGQLPAQAVRPDGVVPLALLVEPPDNSSGIVPDPEVPADTKPLVSIQDIALGRDLHGDLDAPLTDVPLEGLELVGCEVGEDLIRRSLVVVGMAHGGPSSDGRNAVSGSSIAQQMKIGQSIVGGTALDAVHVVGGGLTTRPERAGGSWNDLPLARAERLRREYWRISPLASSVRRTPATVR